MWNKKHISYIMALDVRLNVMTMQIIQHKSIVFYGEEGLVFICLHENSVWGGGGRQTQRCSLGPAAYS